MKLLNRALRLHMNFFTLLFAGFLLAANPFDNVTKPSFDVRTFSETQLPLRSSGMVSSHGDEAVFFGGSGEKDDYQITEAYSINMTTNETAMITITGTLPGNDGELLEGFITSGTTNTYLLGGYDYAYLGRNQANKTCSDSELKFSVEGYPDPEPEDEADTAYKVPQERNPCYDGPHSCSSAKQSLPESVVPSGNQNGMSWVLYESAVYYSDIYTVERDGDKLSFKPVEITGREAPFQLSGFRVVRMGDEFIVLGGAKMEMLEQTVFDNTACKRHKKYMFNSDIWSFNYKKKTWKQYQPATGSSTFIGTAEPIAELISDNAVFVFGGRSSGEPFGKTLDTTTNTMQIVTFDTSKATYTVKVIDNKLQTRSGGIMWSFSRTTRGQLKHAVVFGLGHHNPAYNDVKSVGEQDWPRDLYIAILISELQSASNYGEAAIEKLKDAGFVYDDTVAIIPIEGVFDSDAFKNTALTTVGRANVMNYYIDKPSNCIFGGNSGHKKHAVYAPATYNDIVCLDSYQLFLYLDKGLSKVISGSLGRSFGLGVMLLLSVVALLL